MYQLYLYICNTNIRRRLKVPGELKQGHRKRSDSLMVVLLRLNLENQRLFAMDTVVVVLATASTVVVEIVETVETKYTNLLLAQPRLYQMTCQQNILSKNIEKILDTKKKERNVLSAKNYKLQNPLTCKNKNITNVAIPLDLDLSKERFHDDLYLMHKGNNNSNKKKKVRNENVKYALNFKFN